jgi:RHS repeat-associated protein
MSYDANGNTLSDGINTYFWDARNRLASADNNAAAFAYDPLGRRVSKTFMSTTTNYLYDGANAVQEFGTLPTANLLTGGVDERFQRTSSTETDDYLTDGLGSTVALTDATGASQTQYSYSPFGAQSASGATTTNSYTYTGRESDGLGINYYRARYYNPATGRFMSRDPEDGKAVDPKTLHKYLYAGSDPVNGIDPTGRVDTIETIFTTTVISAPVEIAAEELGYAVAKAFCFIAKTLARATLGIPIGMSGIPGPFPGWPGPAAALCSYFGPFL